MALAFGAAANLLSPVVNSAIRHYSGNFLGQLTNRFIYSAEQKAINHLLNGISSSGMGYRVKRNRPSFARANRRYKGGRYRRQRFTRRFGRGRGRSYTKFFRRRARSRRYSKYGRRIRKSNFIGHSRFAKRLRRKEYRKRLKHVAPIQCNESHDAYISEIHTPAPSLSNATYVPAFYGFPGGGNTAGIKTIARLRGLDHLYQAAESFYSNLQDQSIIQFYDWTTKIKLKNVDPDHGVMVEMFLLKHRPGNMDTLEYGSANPYTLAPWSVNTNGTGGSGDILLPQGLPESALASGVTSNDMDVFSSRGIGNGGEQPPQLNSKHNTNNFPSIWEAWAPNADIFKVPTFVNYWNCISSKKFFLKARQNRTFKWKLPDFELSCEELYNNAYISSGNRALYCHKQEIFVMLRIHGELGVQNIKSSSEIAPNLPVVGYTNAMVIYEVQHKSKHNISNAPRSQYFPNLYGNYLSSTGTWNTGNAYPANNTKMAYPQNSHQVNASFPSVGIPPIRMANVYNGQQSNTLAPEFPGYQYAQMQTGL